MKKKRVNGGDYLSHFKRLLMIMKLTIFLIFAGLMTVSASIYSQATKLSLQMNQVTVLDVFKQIETQSEFVFVYKNETIDLNKKINVKMKESTVDVILDEVLKNLGLKYEIINKQIIITKDRTLPVVTPGQLLPEEQQQPQKKQLKGKITDSKAEGIPGTTVMVKGTTVGTITDSDGNFILDVPLDAKTLSFSFIGYKPQEVAIGNQTIITAVLEEQTVGLEEVVAVGYGVQKKASVVGAISNTKGEVLQRAGGVNNLAQALTGNLPGITTIQTNNQPGKNDPQIFIRGQSTWNGGQPYILVDGVERRMNDIDMSEVDNVSILKDASATAVYGVKGANGVILITTKRGTTGKAKLTINANSTLNYPSKLIEKLDSYDTRIMKNDAIEREVAVNEGSWGDYTPMTVVNRFRNPNNILNLKWPEAYPNVDWQKETIKNTSWDHRVNMNVAGGSDFVKYFGSLAYYNQADILKIPANGKGYQGGFGYNRFNFRSNLDINLSKTTLLKVNLGGIFANRKSTYQYDGGNFYDYRGTVGAYRLPPDAYMLRYSDGFWGVNPVHSEPMLNSAARLANSGIRKANILDISTDFTLNQKLDFITKGLSASASLSFDNHFESEGGIADNASAANYFAEWQDPRLEDLDAYNANILLNGGNASQFKKVSDYILKEPIAGKNQFDYVQPYPTVNDESGTVLIGNLKRRLFYQLQANYARTFGKHDVAGTGVFTREQVATGSEFLRYREDWIFRTTYNYDLRYFAEFNGAYNGSEKFGPDYRFAFFPSAAVGWTISNESFLKDVKWLNKLKLRYSYGFIGDDGGLAARWLYTNQWTYTGSNLTPLGEISGRRSPYGIYTRSQIGNPDIQWEKALKTNAGLEFAVFNNLLSANIEYFTEHRSDILLTGGSRTLPPYYGAVPPTANVGEVSKKGYEIELKFDKRFTNELSAYANFSVTHAKDKIISREEPALLDSYLKAEGYQIDQTRALVTAGINQTWDDIYATTQFASGDNQRLPGDYNILDFNVDGKIDGTKDRVLYGYSIRPQNTFNLTTGINYKGFGLVIQFFGVNNVTRVVGQTAFDSNDNIAYASNADYWTKQNPDGVSALPRWKTKSGQIFGDFYTYDGSYLRLKTAELGYTFSGARIQKYGMSTLRLYVNGNNLLFWSDMPDDREQGAGEYGGYPSARRVNFGVDINF